MMKRIKIRKFLPSLIPMDLTMVNCSHVDIGFLSDSSAMITRIERSVDLGPGGITKNKLVIAYTNKHGTEEYSTSMPEEDVVSLLSKSENKIKKYQYELKHGDVDVYINRYTLGVVTIDIDTSNPLETLPEYCGKEVTEDPQYQEVCLSGMREILKKKRSVEKIKKEER